MARSIHRGKFLILLYLCLVFSLPHRIFGNSASDSGQSEPDHRLLYVTDRGPESGTASDEIDRQELLLQKLEELLKNLSEIVEKLEPMLLESSKLGSLSRERYLEREASSKRDWVNAERLVEKVRGKGFEGKARDGERGRGISITKYNPFWSDRFQFVSAVRLDSDATCVNVLPFSLQAG